MPSASILALMLVNALPTRLPGFAPVVPLLPLIGVYYWSIYRPDLMPPALAFGLGILNDVIAGIPLGVSSLVYLAGARDDRLAAAVLPRQAVSHRLVGIRSGPAAAPLPCNGSWYRCCSDTLWSRVRWPSSF